MKKDTSKLLAELEKSEDFKKYYTENNDSFVKTSLKEQLDALIEKHGLKKSEIIRRSGMSNNYAYQIFNGLRVPEREKLLCLCVAMSLSLDETQTLLKTCSYSQLYVKIPFDCVVIYGIIHSMSVIELNCLLFDYGFETLG